MQGLVSASLVTFVVVAGIAAVGWLRYRANPVDNGKKNDDERVDNDVQIVVDESQNQVKPLLCSVATSPFRQPFVTALRDRLETRVPRKFSSSSESDTTEVDTKHGGEESRAMKMSVAGYHAVKAKANNLSSFVRQCVSNIERTQSAPIDPPVVRPISLQNSQSPSNQSDSEPEIAVPEEHMTSLVAATDCEPTKAENPAEDAVEPAKGPVSKLPRPGNFAKRPSIPSAGPLASVPTPTIPVPSEDSVPQASEKAPLAPRKSNLGRLQQFQQLVPSNQARVTTN
ncbi:hypothetical protein Poli38472_000354 [Pythium oligandrum]|uniref:Uncharacterized protein n=1 Tax=Pythium oligandrum TaxID=41045 RepID=A0A8K1CDJ8_PYTOL|nr:hypothetical protein Poli38472_000354 [Pythium oligandrum]|eukprot:TMW60312.1 hypothetical protein Poli38472_000354 [Pythium oligandrum]